MNTMGLKSVLKKLHKADKIPNTKSKETKVKKEITKKEPKPKKEKKKPENLIEKLKLDGNDIDMIAKMVMAEAEGECFKGKVAVANVIISRVESDLFPNTVKEVIFQKGQFEPILNGRYFKVEPNGECKKAVKEALQGNWAVPKGTYFFLNEAKVGLPNFFKEREFVVKIDNHSFYA
ncbi:cell wall hydrolase [Proteinivorax hydrogeniformans]|uniref:Cell wall hydrolase n=1 Tax=Proteinivorax hydrogeniformans TaxID=1826727 RepID=A0AAU8HTJ5_9FIRM